MNKAKNEGYCDGEWYFFEHSSDAQGKPLLTTPVRLLPSSSGDWFWAADGKGAVTFNHGRFTVHNLP
jgi:hypothetical protein